MVRPPWVKVASPRTSRNVFASRKMDRFSPAFPVRSRRWASPVSSFTRPPYSMAVPFARASTSGPAKSACCAMPRVTRSGSTCGSVLPGTAAVCHPVFPSKACVIVSPRTVTSIRTLSGRLISITNGASVPGPAVVRPVMRSVSTRLIRSRPPLASRLRAIRSSTAWAPAGQEDPARVSRRARARASMGTSSGKRDCGPSRPPGSTGGRFVPAAAHRRSTIGAPWNSGAAWRTGP